MKLTRVLIAAVLCLVAVRSVVADDKQEEKTEIRAMAQKTLQRLYKEQPAAQSAVQNAAGYAVFSNTGVKILVMGSGHGEGVAVSNNSKAETFMKMVELQGGLGFGVKKFSVVAAGLGPTPAFVYRNNSTSPASLRTAKSRQQTPKS